MGTKRERFKQRMNKLFNPGIAAVVLSIPLSTALLLYVFLLGHKDEPVSYLIYLISAYSLILVSVRAVRFFRGDFLSVFHKNRYIHRYLTDAPFKTHVSLYQGFVFNLIYAAGKLASGIYYRSVWFGALAVYYFLLAVMRFLLLRHVNRNRIGRNLFSELRRYRLCGIVLLMMNVALSGVVILVIHRDKGFEYAGILIYVMAMYAFYSIITAVIHVIQYRKYASPVMSAAKAVNLAAALVSMLALETAMLTQFDDGSNPPFFRKAMTAATGAAVCVLVLGMAVFMIVRSTKQLGQWKRNDSRTVPVRDECSGEGGAEPSEASK